MDFDALDQVLLQQKGRIIHQIWFGTIPNKVEAKKAYIKLELYRNSWRIHNPTFFHMEWSKAMCVSLIRRIYPEHYDLFTKYTYEIQRCDMIRYLILHRYGGFYADMDYYCNRPFDEVLRDYPGDLYLVQTPNTMIGQTGEHVSNSLMYSSPGNPFWKKLMIDLEMNKKTPLFYTKHLEVMFTTGPAILNKTFQKNKIAFRLKSYPYKLFHPYGISDDIRVLTANKDVYAIHIGKGSWENADSKLMINVFRNWKIVLFIIVAMLLPTIIYSIVRRKG